MKKAKKLFLNVVILTATSFFMRAINVTFQVYLSNKIGSVGIGLFQLIACVFGFSLTVALSGIKLATTRVVSQELGLMHNSGAKKTLKICVFYSLFFSVSAMIILFFSSNFIGENFLGDTRTVLSLKIYAVCLPFVSVSSVFSGYFTAVRRVYKSAVTQVTEQFLRIGITMLIFTFLSSDDLEYACASIVVGAVVAEILSFVMLFFLFVSDKKKYKNDGKSSTKMSKKVLSIALPLAFSSYVRSGLSTVEHLLVPVGLKKSGASTQGALTTYGTIHGMVLPIVLFPCAVLDVLAELLVPEITECQSKKHYKRMNYMITRVFQMGMIFSIGVSGIMFEFSTELGLAIYGCADSSYYIKIFSPLVIVMYMDTLVDGMLKGLGAQVSSMRYNIIDAFIGVVLVLTLIPKFAVMGYILTIIITEFVNFILSIRKLIKIADFNISLITCCIKPVFCMLSSISISNVIFRYLTIFSPNTTFVLLIKMMIVMICYASYLYMFACLNKEDTKWFKSLIK